MVLLIVNAIEIGIIQMRQSILPVDGVVVKKVSHLFHMRQWLRHHVRRVHER